MGVLRDSDNSWYMREEAGGLLLGPYEKEPHVVMSMVPQKIVNMIVSGRFDRLAPHIEGAIKECQLLEK